MTALGGLTAVPDRPRVLHVSADFPDSIDSFKTPVVRTLVDLTRERFDHEVISLNRRSPDAWTFGRELVAGLGTPRLSIGRETFDYGQALIYRAPPRGFFHATLLRRLGDWLADHHAGPLPPDLLVGHKLTIEGIAVRRAAQRLGVPYALCIQGDTDTKVLAARPDLGSEFAKVFHEAAVVFPFTPWALRRFEDRFGRRAGPTTALPCPTDLDWPTPPEPSGDGLVSVFHLKNHRRKNLQGLVGALEILRGQGREVPFEIIGGGSTEDTGRCRSVTRDLPSVAFKGPLDRCALKQRLNGKVGFVLPSLRESFGLVFIEALFAGLPVVYPKDAAIDGYFDGFTFAIGVDARNPSAIAAAMETLLRDERKLKADLAHWQSSEHASRFRRAAIGDTFAQGLMSSIDMHAGSPV